MQQNSTKIPTSFMCSSLSLKAKSLWKSDIDNGRLEIYRLFDVKPVHLNRQTVK